MRRSSARRQLVTVVAFLAAAGVDPSEIARRTGHSSVSFTYDRYGHLFPEIDAHAATKLDAIRAGRAPWTGPLMLTLGNRQELPCLRVEELAHPVHRFRYRSGPGQPSGSRSVDTPQFWEQA